MVTQKEGRPKYLIKHYYNILQNYRKIKTD